MNYFIFKNNFFSTHSKNMKCDGDDFKMIECIKKKLIKRIVFYFVIRSIVDVRSYNVSYI